MRTAGTINIDPGESFGRLENAPIIEAIIEFRGPVRSPWEEENVKEQFQSRLADTQYEYLDTSREYRQHVAVRADMPKTAQSDVQYVGWKGLRFRSADKKHNVQFNRNGFVFSWLEPYETWGQFQDEALLLWRHYRDIGCTDSIERIGVRFINRIPLGNDSRDAGDYVTSSPAPPSDLPLCPDSFFHVDEFEVPGHAYRLKITTTIQREEERSPNSSSIILDIDVFTTRSPESSEDALIERLQEMRWLKNKAFLGCITDKAKKEMREKKHVG